MNAKKANWVQVMESARFLAATPALKKARLR
jgi:hypothetical protein